MGGIRLIMGGFIDISGQRFGRLVVVERAQNYKNATMWVCLCDCGNEVTINGSSLKRELTKSCGCYNSELVSERSRGNLLGKKFGKLKVIEFIGPNDKNQIQWKCVCDCGVEKVTTTWALQSGNTKSCGCYRSEANRTDGLSSARNAMYYYRKGALKRGYAFNLSLEEFMYIAAQNCLYCGHAADKKYVGYGCTNVFIFNGIDRYINSIGYVVENCVPCCTACNYAKGEMDGPEYLEHCRRVASHWSNREMERAA